MIEAEVLRRVLVAVDGSESGEAALHWAAFVAGRAGAEAVAVSPWIPQQAELPPDEWNAEHAERLARVHRAVDRAAVGLDHRIEVVEGKATSVLLDQQDREDADLLVVRLPGHGGSRSDSIPPGRAGAPDDETTAAVPDGSRPGIDRIVLGVDGSASSLRAATCRGAPVGRRCRRDRDYVPDARARAGVAARTPHDDGMDPRPLSNRLDSGVATRRRADGHPGRSRRRPRRRPGEQGRAGRRGRDRRRPARPCSAHRTASQ